MLGSEIISGGGQCITVRSSENDRYGKKRNRKLDILRGFAASVVVLGHVLALYAEHENNLLFNMIFSIQMPLFMLLSGFAVVYSKPVQTADELASHIKKRVLTLLLPWFVWSTIAYFVFARGVDVVAYIQAAAFHMESAFWFLFSLFFIDTIFVASSFASAQLKPKAEWRRKIYIIAGCIVGTFALLLIGSQVGITFLGIKYTAYYIPYYLLGWLVGTFVESTHFHTFRKYFLNILLLILLIVYSALIMSFNVYTMQDTLVNIIIRMCISGCGCIFLLGLVYILDEPTEARLEKVFRLPSKYSLELYVVQYFVLHFLSTEGFSVSTVTGFVHCMAYFVIVYALCGAIISIINVNPLAAAFFFGKMPKSKYTQKRRERHQIGDPNETEKV